MRRLTRPLATATTALLVAGSAGGDEAAGGSDPVPDPRAIETVVLDSGDVLKGRIVSRDDEFLVLEHPTLGRMRIPAARIASIGAPPEPEPEPEAAKPVNPGLFGTRFLRGWKRSIGAGVSGSGGNADTVAGNAAITGGEESESHRWEFDSAYAISTDGNDLNKSQGFAELEREWLFPGSPWFAFAGPRYEFNGQTDFRHRIGVAAGPGYAILDDDVFRWTLRGAPAYNHTTGDQTNTFELLLGTRFTWNIVEGQRFGFHSTIFPSLNDAGEFRTRSGASYSIALTDWGLGLKLGATVETRSEDDDSTNYDVNYSSNLTYDF